MADRYNKVFLAMPPQYEALDHQTKMLFAFVRASPVESDGTIAVVSEGEKVYQAIARTYGISPRQRRRYDKPTTDLFKWGFLTLHGSRVVVPHWELQQAWRKGALPPMRCEPDPAALARIARETSTGLLGDFLGTSPTLLRHFSGTSPILVGDFSKPNATKSQDTVGAKRDPTSRLGSYRVGLAPRAAPVGECHEWGDDDDGDPFDGEVPF